MRGGRSPCLTSSRRPRPRRAATDCSGHPTDLAGHLATLGPVPLPGPTNRAWRDAFVSALEASGLAGAAVPVSRPPSSSRLPVPAGGGSILVNAMEGEPASDKDKLLLIRSPHLVLDGAQLLAAASGGPAGSTVCVPEGAPPCRRGGGASAGRASGGRLCARPEAMVRPPDRFIAGEESALARWVETGQSLPSFRPDKGRALRIGRGGALVHNAETLAHVAMIARTGPDAFRAHGLIEDPGTSLVTISGAVEHPGVVEIDRGTPLIDIANRACPTGPPQALSRRWVRRCLGGSGALHDALRLALAPCHRGDGRGRHRHRARPATACGLMESARIAHYLAGQSAGQCGPCVYGLPGDRRRPDAAGPGAGRSRARARLERRLGQVDGRGACRHPDGAVNLVRSALHVFAADVDMHTHAGAVRALEPPVAAPVPRHGTGGLTMLRILIDPVACDAYGYCAELLPESISLDEWGYPIVDGKPLPPELVAMARRAARDCPRRAITLRERKGGH